MTSQSSKVLRTGYYYPISCTKYISSGFSNEGYLVRLSEGVLGVYTHEVIEKPGRIFPKRTRSVVIQRHAVSIQETEYNDRNWIDVYLYDQSLEQLVHNLLKEYLNYLSEKKQELVASGLLSVVPEVMIRWYDKTMRKVS